MKSVWQPAKRSRVLLSQRIGTGRTHDLLVTMPAVQPRRAVYRAYVQMNPMALRGRTFRIRIEEPAVYRVEVPRKKRWATWGKAYVLPDTTTDFEHANQPDEPEQR